MKSPSFIANALLVAIGCGGATWYIAGAGSRFFLVLVYFALLAVVGLSSIFSLVKDSYPPSVAAGITNKISLLILAALLLSAFAVSPGSGAAVLPFIGLAAAINIVTLSQLGGSGRTKRSNRSRVERAPV